MDQQVFSFFNRVLKVKSPAKLLIDTVVSKKQANKQKTSQVNDYIQSESD